MPEVYPQWGTVKCSTRPRLRGYSKYLASRKKLAIDKLCGLFRPDLNSLIFKAVINKLNCISLSVSSTLVKICKQDLRASLSGAN
jgi:hypothetical protein